MLGTGINEPKPGSPTGKFAKSRIANKCDIMCVHGYPNVSLINFETTQSYIDHIEDFVNITSQLQRTGFIYFGSRTTTTMWKT